MRRTFFRKIVIGFLITGSTAWAYPKLDARERDELRYRLENAWNEVDLLVRNERIDSADSRKQDRDFATFGIFDKIPLQKRKMSEEDFRKILTPSLEASSLKLKKVFVAGSPGQIKPALPKIVHPDQTDFQLKETQLTGKYRLDLIVEGQFQDLNHWIADWNETYTPDSKKKAYPPLLEWDGRIAKKATLQRLADNRWRLRVAAYVYRDIRFPKVVPRSPRALLPAWARSHPTSFSAHEPLLWSFVEKTEKLLPKTPPLYEKRGEFILNAARLSFFLRKLGS